MGILHLMDLKSCLRTSVRAFGFRRNLLREG